MYAEKWRSTGAMPQWLAYDLSEVPAVQRRETVVFWDSGNYNYVSSGTRYNCPGIYTIDVHPAAGGTNPPDENDPGWVTLVSYDNTVSKFNSRQHVISLTNGSTVYNWIRMRVTEVNGTTYNWDAYITLDIHDAHLGRADNWLFLGDSITAGGMSHNDSVGANFSQLINNILPDYFPVQENAGMGGWHTDDAVSNNIDWINAFTGQYVCIAYGTNDAGYNFSYQRFYDNYEILVNAVFNAGKIPLIPTIPWCSAPYNLSNIPTLNAALAQLKTDYSQILDGPDFWSFFQDNPGLLCDPLHPSDAGYTEYRRLWAEKMIEVAYHSRLSWITVNGNRFEKDAQPVFMSGANTPWHQ